ncbi:MAG: hypothetical protein LLG16_06090 [Euryarchaeota archaeon]|nr:hypothetical protein [Euryarchaeota archaeon]
MASDAAISQTVFFIAAIVVAASLAGVIIGVGFQMGEKIEDQADALGDSIATDIVIINDPTMMPYSDGELTIYVENIGTSVMGTYDVMVMLDGVYNNETAARLDGSSSKEWGPSTILVLTVGADIDEGDHTIKVITGSGRSDTFLFRV